MRGPDRLGAGTRPRPAWAAARGAWPGPARRSGLDHHQTFLGYLPHGPGRALLGVAAGPDPAVGHLVGPPGGDLVDQDPAEVERAGRLQGGADVAGEDGGLEPEAGVVGQAQGLGR